MAQPTLTPREFAQKWGDNTQKESSTSREHFIVLCRMLCEPTPNEADPTGTTYAFEKAVTKAVGGDGFADVWKKDFFGWEYKGKGKDLKAAYLQLLGYREDLSNPPVKRRCRPPVGEWPRHHTTAARYVDHRLWPRHRGTGGCAL